MDDIVLTILRDIMLRNINGAVRPNGAELVTLDVIARARQAPLGTRRFALGALSWLDGATQHAHRQPWGDGFDARRHPDPSTIVEGERDVHDAFSGTVRARQGCRPAAQCEVPDPGKQIPRSFH